MKRVAVVGTGKMGMLHASLLNTLPDVQLVALCEKSSLIRRYWRKILKDVSVVEDVKELFGLDLDAVYVTTPISSHFPVIHDIYSKGIADHIFVEKPLASSYAEAKDLCDLVRRHSSVNMVGYCRRFSVTFGKAKEILNDGTLGELVFFKGYAYSSDFVTAKKGSKSLAAGEALRDLGCHAVDLAIWLFNEMEVKSAKIKSQPDDPDDLIYFRVETPAGLEGEFQSSRCMMTYRMPEIVLIIKGSRGMLSVNDDKIELKLDSGRSTIWYKHDLGDNVGFFLGGSDYFREDECFIQAILDGRDIQPNFQTSLKVEQILDKVKEIIR